jgi:mono/diheme cytochrome c family protein
MSRPVGVLALVAGALALVVVLMVAGVYGFSALDLNATYEVDVAPLAVTQAGTNGGLVEWGEHVAITRGCLDCHARDGGGQEFVDDAAFGRLWSSNLTPGEGGIGATYTDADWDRAIRHGVRPDGKPLIFMPSHEFWRLSDEDVASLIAYFRSIPGVDRAIPRPRPGPLARALHLAGQLKLVPAKIIDHEASRPAAPEASATVEYGEYLATGCTGCHNASYTGGKIAGGDPSWPDAANLTPHETGIGAWTQSDFSRALREGIRPDGRPLDPSMPVAATKHMTDTELEALFAYLMTLEPKPFGER